MKTKRLFGLIAVFLLALQPAISQSVFSFSSQEVEERLKADVYSLASDEMQGRESGTEGEEMAAHYIKERMEEAGLKPLFEQSYFQPFEFYGSWTLGPDNFLIVSDQEFVLDQDFFVLPNATNASVNAEAVYVGFGLQRDEHDDYKELAGLEGKIFIMEFFLPDSIDDRSAPQPTDVIREKVEVATQLGARAILFVNTQSWRNDPSTRLNQNLGAATIPVLFARSEVFEYWQQLGENANVFLSAEKDRPVYTSYNVAGYLDNEAEFTVVIGGHFDHLGLGGAGSRSPGVSDIHYGADDNASGVAGLLEAARYLTHSTLTGYNYIFIAFGAEEKGLLGSRHFAESDAYDMGSVNYMFNFDMIGRKENGNLSLIGTGTSPTWDSLIDRHDRESLQIRKSPSGLGGSDHSNFYLKNIPVLFFFTGIHDDYHRPSDTPDKVNYEGMVEILSFTYDMMSELNDMEKLEFAATPMTRRGAQRRSDGPTLGLMPDHAWDGQGLRVLAVVEDRPAQKAGIKDGDIIVKIAEIEISDIQSYMSALGTLTAKQTVKVVVLRDGNHITLDVNL